MTTIRRRLRLWVTAWFVFQVVSLSALGPRDCCAAHRPPASAKAPSCHESTAATYCPTRAASGTPCPMHGGNHSDADHKSAPKCSMRGTCDGPMAALSALLSNHGVLSDAFSMLPDLQTTGITAHTGENLIGRLASPDPPPPRA